MSRRTAVRAAIIVVAIVAVGALAVASLWPALAPTARPSPTDTVVASTVPSASEASGVPSASVAVSGASALVGSPSPSPTAAPALTHVWWIVMENHEYDGIIGNAAAPYLNDLAARYGVATNFYATGHPSEPNYIAMVAGSTLGVTSDGTFDLAGPSIFSQLAHGGRSWRAYAQDYPGKCFTGSSASGGLDGPGAPGSYARKHVPAMSFTAISGDPAQCAEIQPLYGFDPAAGAFEMVSPNLINDMHDGSVAQGDAFLKAFVPLITGSPAFRSGVLFITFDEGSSNAGSQGDSGGHVATLIIGPAIQPGLRISAYADQFSLLRTTEDALGLPCLGAACSHAAMRY